MILYLGIAFLSCFTTSYGLSHTSKITKSMKPYTSNVKTVSVVPYITSNPSYKYIFNSTLSISKSNTSSPSFTPMTMSFSVAPVSKSKSITISLSASLSPSLVSLTPSLSSLTSSLMPLTSSLTPLTLSLTSSLSLSPSQSSSQSASQSASQSSSQSPSSSASQSSSPSSSASQLLSSSSSPSEQLFLRNRNILNETTNQTNVNVQSFVPIYILDSQMKEEIHIGMILISTILGILGIMFISLLLYVWVLTRKHRIYKQSINVKSNSPKQYRGVAPSICISSSTTDSSSISLQLST
jgi:hypothetical protein